MLQLDSLKIIIISAACLLMQLCTGTSVVAALLLTCAVFCGLFAITSGGGLSSVAGLLSGIILLRYLLIAILIKTAVMKPTDDTLLAPVSTPAVMAVGFFALMLGVVIQRHMPRPRKPLIPEPKDPQMYLALTIVLFAFGYGGFFITGGDEARTGGIFGIAHAVSQFKAFTIVPAMYFAWSSGSKRFMTHPLVLAILLTGAVMGIFSTSKQNAMEPLIFYLVVSAIRYGFKDRRLWILSASGLLYYAVIIYPYAQYSRGNGGREGSLATKLESVKSTFWLMLTDPNYRSSAQSKIGNSGSNYFDNEKLEPFNRFAMIGEADRLIYATDAQQAFTGWETITWGLKRMLPSFIYPDKPIFGAANFLAQITGDTALSDLTTQVSFGIMANCYNAFGLSGVFFLCTTFFAVFLYSCRFWFGDVRIAGLTEGGSLWAILLVASYHHGLVEETMAGLLPSMELPSVVLIVLGAAKCLLKVMPQMGHATNPGRSRWIRVEAPELSPISTAK